MAAYTLSNTAAVDSLNGAINASTLTVTLTDASTYPSADFLLRVNAEVMDVQSRTGNVLTVRTGGRGHDSTTAASHGDTDEAVHVVAVQDFFTRKTVGASTWEAQGPLIMGSNKITGLTAGTTTGEAVEFAAMETAIDTDITTHAAISTAHHTKYTDGEADARIALANLTDLVDVVISGTPADNEVVAWNTGTSRFINQTHAEAGVMSVGAAPTAHTIASHSDTTGTGAELNTLTGGGSTTLHSHSVAHSATTGRTASDHHTKYTDTEAAAKIAADDLYVKVAGDVMGGVLDMNQNQIQMGLGTGIGTGLAFDGAGGAHDTEIYSTGDGNMSFRANAQLAFSISSSQLLMADDLNMNNQPLLNPLDPTLATMVGDRGFNDGRYMQIGDAPTAHTVASHSDTTGTGAELNTLTGGGSTTLHSHAVAHSATTGKTANDHHNELHTVASHSDVTITTVATGEIIAKSAGDWINQTLAEAGIMAVGAAPTAHTIASHSDTTGTGAELNTLTGGGDVGALHTHAAAYATAGHTIVSHDTTTTGAELTELTDGTNADHLHIHAGGGYIQGDVILADYGTALLPGYGFDLDPNTGMFHVADDVIGWSTAGVVRVSLEAANFALAVPIWADYGTEANPGMAFSGDDDTGFYRAAIDTIGITVGGNDVAQFEDNEFRYYNADGKQSGFYEMVGGATREAFLMVGGTSRTATQPWIGIWSEDDSGGDAGSIALRDNGPSWFIINNTEGQFGVPVFNNTTQALATAQFRNVTVKTTAPTTPDTGDMWLDNS